MNLREGLAKRRYNQNKKLDKTKRNLYKPLYAHNLFRWLKQNRPELVPLKREKLPLEFIEQLVSIGMTKNQFSRIVMNTCLVSLDEMYQISILLGCSMNDII